jgi:tetratricopeptide (TPR) repeat protein
VKRASGLPLFVKFLIEDLLAGRIDFFDPEKLPLGLNEYYERLLKGLSVGDLNSLVTPIIAALSISKYPLDQSALCELFVYARRIYDKRTGVSLIEETIKNIDVLVALAPTPWGNTGIILTHETLLTYTYETEHLENERSLIKETLLHLIDNSDLLEQKGNLYKYVLLAGPTHLLDEGRIHSFLNLCGVKSFFHGCVKAIEQGIRADYAKPWINALAKQNDPRLLPCWIKACEIGLYMGRIPRVHDCIKAVKHLSSRFDGNIKARLLFIDATCLRLKGELSKSIEYFEKIRAVADDKLADRIEFEHANAIRESGGYDKAASKYLFLVKKTKVKRTRLADYLIFGQQLCDVYYVQGKIIKALDLLDSLSSKGQIYKRELSEIERIRGHMFRMMEYPEKANESYQKALTLFKEVDDVFGIARIETNLAETFARLDPNRALEYSKRSQNKNDQLGAIIEVGKAINARGQALQALGDLSGASNAFEEAKSLQVKAGYRSGVAMVLINQVHLEIEKDRHEQALSLFKTASQELQKLKAYPFLEARAALLALSAGIDELNMQKVLSRVKTDVEWIDGFESYKNRMIKLYWSKNEKNI